MYCTSVWEQPISFDPGTAGFHLLSDEGFLTVWLYFVKACPDLCHWCDDRVVVLLVTVCVDWLPMALDMFVSLSLCVL
jgi:hypothetical protein